MSLASLIQKSATADPNGDPTRIAGRILDQTPKTELVALLAEEVAHVQRGLARTAEQQALTKGLLSKPASEHSEAFRLAFKKLAGTQFSLGRGFDEMIAYVDASPTKLRERAIYLRKLAAGTVESAVRCEKLADRLDEEGVGSLRELIEKLDAAA